MGEDRSGRLDSNEQLVQPPLLETVGESRCHYEGPGVRKAVLLARYVSVMRRWIWDETCNLIADGVPACTDLSKGVFGSHHPDELRRCPAGHNLKVIKIGQASSGHD